MSEIKIVYEDQWLLIVNKPAGLPTQPSVDRKRPSLYSHLLESKRWPYVGLHHRLDVPTSGLVLLTKDKSANKPVGELFKGRELKKTYLCLCQGRANESKFQIQNHLKPLRLKSGKTKMTVVNSGGDFAHTDFEVLEEFEEATLIKAMPHTGRMHQIRVHLAHIGLPILGDSLYFRIDRKYPRVLLHAYQLNFSHPINKTNLLVEAPLPDDFEAALKRHRKT